MKSGRLGNVNIVSGAGMKAGRLGNVNIVSGAGMNAYKICLRNIRFYFNLNMRQGV